MKPKVPKLKQNQIPPATINDHKGEEIIVRSHVEFFGLPIFFKRRITRGKLIGYSDETNMVTVETASGHISVVPDEAIELVK